MPSEPENKIEELLKAYAKKRQEEAGAPFEMHPATRKLLQGEVARRQPVAVSLPEDLAASPQIALDPRR